jgi:hypothetical protein
VTKRSYLFDCPITSLFWLAGATSSSLIDPELSVKENAAKLEHTVTRGEPPSSFVALKGDVLLRSSNDTSAVVRSTPMAAIAKPTS